MNKTDYNKIFEKEAEENRGKTLLLHCCCAPCLLGVVERVIPHFSVTLYWYNPNIMPREEHDKRLGELKKVADIFGLPLVIDDYAESDYLTAVKGRENAPEGGERCVVCQTLRIEKTARYASSHSFDFFATTLSVSPHKNAALINSLGENAQRAGGARWLHNDFKKKEGFKRSGELCEKYGIYRQNYCGCKFTEQ